MTDLKYTIYQVTDPFSAGAIEHLGSKRKGWFTYKLQGKDIRVLFKQGVAGSGENWAEKVAGELAGSLDLPHAIYELAYLNLNENEPGVISPNFLRVGEELKLGNELIEGFDKNQKFKNIKHTLTAMLNAMEQYKVQVSRQIINQQRFVTKATDLFIGYLCFYAWIGNTDLHAENWGIINKIDVSGKEINILAPTFDHASSLGRNETDQRRKERLTTTNQDRTVLKYVQSAITPIYSQTGNRLSSIDLIQECRQYDPHITDHWITQIIKITEEEQTINRIFNLMPTTFMSDLAKEFAKAFLQASSRQLRRLQRD